MSKIKKYIIKHVWQVIVIISVLVLSGSYIVVQENKQNSIERQKQISEDREYISKRKQECFELYKFESDKWSNTTSWSYRKPSNNKYDFGYSDKCVIEYKGDDGEIFTKDY